MIEWRKVIILAKSYKKKNRCLAGIFYDNGDWVRPISSSLSTAMDPKLVDSLTLLDIVEIPLAKKEDPPSKYQKENWIIGNGTWKIVGKYDREDLLLLYKKVYQKKGELILHSNKKYVDPVYLENVHNSNWKSLELYRSNTRFYKDYDSGERYSLRATFKDPKGNYLDLSVTDVDFLKRMSKATELNCDCLLTISLTRPWSDNNLKRCYKLVAGVIEL